MLASSEASLLPLLKTWLTYAANNSGDLEVVVAIALWLQYCLHA